MMVFNNRVLVTGGLGFIGKHLCKKLLELGLHVTCLDDESASTEDAKEFIEGNDQHSSQFSFVCGSVLDKSLLLRLLREDDIDLVFHLAAKLGVKNIIDNQLEMLETNVLGTHNVLEAVSSTSTEIPVFIASSSEVYGKSDAVPFTESSSLMLGPTSVARWGYAASKILDEFEALAFWHESRLPVVVGRFFNIVGPGQPPESGMVIPKMVEAALDGRPLEVLGDGLQRRCFCHVDDCVDALASLMMVSSSSCYPHSIHSSLFGEVFNIGNPENEVTMLDLALKTKSIVGSRSEVKLVPYSEVYSPGSFEDMRRRVPSISKLEEALGGWRPTKTLDDIVTDAARDLQR